MQWIVIIALLLPLGSLAAQSERKLLKCLGEEEKRFHLKKRKGPLFELNQRMIEEMLQIPMVEVVPEVYEKICKTKSSESLKLLNFSIQLGSSLFYIPESITGMQREMTIGMINDYVETSKDILLNLIAQIQTAAPTPHCLQEEIPRLNKFFIQVKYLQEDVDIKEIFKHHEGRILEELNHYPKAFKKCQERLKKKLKSESTSEAKKP